MAFVSVPLGGASRADLRGFARCRAGYGGVVVAPGRLPLSVRQCARSDRVDIAGASAVAAQTTETHGLAPSVLGLPEIKVVASDVDGTLLTTGHTLPDDVSRTIVEMMDAGIAFFPATGKSRIGALNSFCEPLKSRLGVTSPGVYLQGLVVYKEGGELLYERALEPGVVAKVAQKARDLDCAWVAYSGDRILCEPMSARNQNLVDSLTEYHEPQAETDAELVEKIMGGSYSINKALLIADEQFIDTHRPAFRELLVGEATLTQAQADMLEILPLGASKGDGVRRLLDHLGFSFSELMAIGDAENDLEMLKFAGIGCAVGNALPSVKAAADFEVRSNNEGGVSEAIRRFVLKQ
ncbi:putative phosphatase [Porphyridium purpureum]|uniref:Putative phosphatase n=1 Tax=Porphyridium purpureum TaxID=35688 RepID=A0A5J4YU78_PORPP|nr:putative phosphatase [Porphyridium purpureum]|eukprot:POR2684..scf229_5